MTAFMKSVAEFLGDDQLFCFLDCGSLGGPDSRWLQIVDKLHYIGFDGNASDCQRQTIRAKELGLNWQFICAFLGGRDNEQRTFYLNSAPESNSFYPLNHELLNRFKLFNPYITRQDGGYGCLQFPSDLKSLGTEIITTESLDTAISKNISSEVDFIKLDLEGAELEVLSGAKNVLAKVVAVEVEVVFAETRKGTPLFCDVDVFMKENGFTFHSFEYTHTAHFAGRAVSPVTQLLSKGDLIGHSQVRGQLITADALYVRDPLQQGIESKFTWYPISLLKLILVYAAYNYLEAALEVANALCRNQRAGGNTMWADQFDAAVTKSLTLMGYDNAIFSSK